MGMGLRGSRISLSSSEAGSIFWFVPLVVALAVQESEGYLVNYKSSVDVPKRI